VLPVEEVTVAFSPGGEALALILQELRQARCRIDIAMFYLSHDALLDTVCYLANSRKMQVRMLVDRDMAQPARRPILDRMRSHGVDIFVASGEVAGMMHMKAVVIDEEIVITGAANWSKAAFAQNVEDTLILRSRGVAKLYRARIGELIKQAEPFYESGDLKTSVVRALPTVERAPGGKAARSFSVAAAEIFFTPRAGAPERLLQLLRKAHHIQVGMYVLRDRDVLDTLEARTRAGQCQIEVIVDKEMLDYRSVPHLERLTEAGATVRVYRGDRESMHLKSGIVDRRYLWTGSANWTPDAFRENAEDLLCFDAPELAAYYGGFMQEIAERSTDVLEIIGRKHASVPPAPRPTQTGWFTGLPPTGPRTSFEDIGRPDAFPGFTVKAATRYLPDEEYLPVLIKLIKSAEQSIFVSMYVMPEAKSEQPHLQEVIDALSAAGGRGVYVYLLLFTPFSANDRLAYAHSNWAEKLRAEGIDVRLASPAINLHAKMVVVDLAMVLIGSHNWSDGALSGERVYEASALLILPHQDERFVQYILSRPTISDMRSRIHWENEIAALRKLRMLSGENRARYLEQLQPEPEP